MLDPVMSSYIGLAQVHSTNQIEIWCFCRLGPKQFLQFGRGQCSASGGHHC